MQICPICYEKHGNEKIVSHLNNHGYDNIQANILLDYDSTHKGLIDQVNIRIPEFDDKDIRYTLYDRFLKETYRFCMPGHEAYTKLNTSKDIVQLVGIYKEIIGCQLYQLKVTLESKTPNEWLLDIFRFQALNDIYQDVSQYLTGLTSTTDSQVNLNLNAEQSNVRIVGGTIFFSWDQIEFGDRKLFVKIVELNKQFTFDNVPSSQVILNLLKDDFFKLRYADKEFSIILIDNKRVDTRRSTILKLEDLLKAESENIEHVFKKITLRENERINQVHLVRLAAQRSEIIKDKHKYIQSAAKYLGENDKLYSIRENNNGADEGLLLMEFRRPIYNYVLVENENINRSAHLFIFGKSVNGYIEKIHGYYSSKRSNKRKLLKEKLIDLAREFDSKGVKTLYHSDLEAYKLLLKSFLSDLA